MRPFRSTHSSGGYSLVELLVVIVIIGFLLTFGISRYRTFTERHQVENIARGVVSALRTAQEMSLSGIKREKDPNSLCNENGEWKGTGLSIQPNRYYMFVFCEREDPHGTLTVVFDVKDLPQNVVFAGSGTNISNFLFKPLAKGVEITGESTIGICSTKSDASLGIRVSTTGEIGEVAFNCAGAVAPPAWWASLGPLQSAYCLIQHYPWCP